MKGLLVAATGFEIEPCIKALKQNAAWQVVIAGIGGTATAYALTRFVEKFKPDVMVQAGIAGSFDKQLNLGDVVIAGSECFGDLGVIEEQRRKSIFELNLQSASEKPFKGGRLQNPHKKLLEIVPLQVVDAVSVNEITTSIVDIDFYKDDLNVSIESMEGAAFHYVALMENIPFLQVRSVSNYVGERDKAKWDVQLAVSNLNKEVLTIVEKLMNQNSPFGEFE